MDWPPNRYHLQLEQRSQAVGILTNIVAAEEDEIATVGESLRPCDEWSGMERRGVDTAKIVTLHCLLTGDLYEQAVALYEPIYISDEGVIVIRFADYAMERLAEMEEYGLDEVAAELSATEEFEYENWDAEEVHAMVMELADLARLAESQGQILLVWMHPLMT
jgi:hypothetical protein